MESNRPVRIERVEDSGYRPVPSGDSHVADDEISLIDLWIVLWRRKWLALAVAAVVLAAGITLAAHRPVRYRYSTTVEFGAITSVGLRGLAFASRGIDTPQTVQTKLKDSIIPTVLQEYAARHPHERASVSLKAEADKLSQVVVISGVGGADQGPVFAALFKKVTAALNADHKRLTQGLRAGYEANLAQQKILLERLRDPTRLKLKKLTMQQAITGQQDAMDRLAARIALVKVKYKHLDNAEALVRQELSEFEQSAKTNAAAYDKILASHQNQSTPLALLMLNGAINKGRAQMASLQRELQVSIPEQRHALQDQLADLGRQREMVQQKLAKFQDELAQIPVQNERAIALQMQRIAKWRARLDSLPETRALGEPVRSRQPVGIGRLKLLAVFLFLGGILALFTVFLVELIGKARERIRAEAMRSEAS